VRYAKAHDLEVVLFPYDTTRAREEDLTNLLTRMVQDAPPDSVGIVDTMGCVLPGAMKYLVRLVKRLTNGFRSKCIHTTTSGWRSRRSSPAWKPARKWCTALPTASGERTGNAALEELIVALHVLYGYETSYRLDRLPELERWSAVSATPRSR